ETINSQGGFLLPDEIFGTIVVVREKFGAFRRAAQVVSMRRDVMSVARRTSGITVTFLSEGTAPTESQTGFDNVNLVAKKCSALIRASSELDEDSPTDLGEFLVNELGYAYAVKEDACGFNG